MLSISDPLSQESFNTLQQMPLTRNQPNARRDRPDIASLSSSTGLKVIRKDKSLLDEPAPDTATTRTEDRHTVNTEADKTLLDGTVGIPPNLRGLEGAVCRYDFTTTDDGRHLMERDARTVVSIWSKDPANYLVSPFDRHVSCVD